jgi:RNA polymerase sigma-70 factor (ECF subfamily)
VTYFTRRAAGTSSDQELIERIASSDRVAMGELYMRHHERVYRFARRKIGDPTAAEDVVSEVFLVVWQHAARFEGRCSVSTWLLAITRNKALQGLPDGREAELDEEIKLVPDIDDNPEIETLKNDRRATLRRLIGQLPPKHAEVVDLVYYHEKSVAEVAYILGIPESTVKVRMHYARKRLRILIETAELGGPVH